MKLLFIIGGQSPEHEVSLNSYRQIYQMMRQESYAITVVGIDKEGGWHEVDAQIKATAIDQTGPLFDMNRIRHFDVAFPVLHGPNGEDGTVQGLLRCFGVPCVGSGVLGSACGMDKDVMKRLFEQAGIPQAPYLVAYKGTLPSFAEVAQMLKVPFFIKPANMGSSIGIAKVKKEEEYAIALEEAFDFDSKVVIEQAVVGREFNMGVIESRVSMPCELVPKGELMDYSAKYLDSTAAERIYPAPISEEQRAEMERLALKSFRVCCCSGYARVDTFINEEGRVIVNEINTIPGFTPFSPFPIMWEKSGLCYADLVDELITLAVAIPAFPK